MARSPGPRSAILAAAICLLALAGTALWDEGGTKLGLAVQSPTSLRLSRKFQATSPEAMAPPPTAARPEAEFRDSPISASARRPVHWRPFGAGWSFATSRAATSSAEERRSSGPAGSRDESALRQDRADSQAPEAPPKPRSRAADSAAGGESGYYDRATAQRPGMPASATRSARSAKSRFSRARGAAPPNASSAPRPAPSPSRRRPAPFLEALDTGGRRGRAARLQRPLRHRPILLSRLLGPGALKPPRGVEPPTESPWSGPLPETLADGTPILPQGLSLADIEAAAPPELPLSGPGHPKTAHWHEEGPRRYFHEERLWGRWQAKRWSWLERADGRWWIWGSQKKPPLLRHQEHWWWNTRGAWFLLHEGQPWGWAYLELWKREGLVNAEGVQMIYSRDLRRVAVVVPGEGAVLHDSETGEELGRWSQEELPRRRPPAANMVSWPPN